MANISYIFTKAKETYREEGFKRLVGKSIAYTKKRLTFYKEKRCYKDILFINGCTLPHPSRYRVDHQIEQLLSNGLTADSVFYESLTLEMEKYYREIGRAHV